MKLTLGQIADILHAEGDFLSTTEIFGYSIDTRTLAAGDLYFAVTGERFDGHEFVEAALQNGAAAAVVSTRWVVPSEIDVCKLLRVPDSEDCVLRAMQTLARGVRRMWAALPAEARAADPVQPRRVIGITGSAGKTTTKECVAAVLSARFNVLKSAGNLNNGFGLPLQLLKLEPEHEVAVLEMGMNHAGEIAALARIAEPDWAVVSNVAPVHLEYFPDGLSGIAAAKYELVQALPPGGIAFLNADDPHVRTFGRNRETHARYFGLHAGTKVPHDSSRSNSSETNGVEGNAAKGAPRPDAETGDGVTPNLTAADHLQSEGADGTSFIVHTATGSANARIALLGEHNVYNALAGITVGLESGIPLEECIAALAQLQPSEKRGEILHWHGAQILNDTYNSNPRALDGMVDALTALSATRRIVVAGEMLELGSEAAQLHRCCGQHMRAQGIHAVIAVRGHARSLAEGFGEGAIFVETPEEAGSWLKQHLQTGDAVLLKASRGVRLERALESLQSFS